MGSSLRVLIVEDMQAKIAKIVELLVDAGFSNREDIAVAQSGFDARTCLKANQYDLMILDVVLPNRPEEEPIADGGVQLLRELMSRDHLLRPRYVIGLTAYPSSFQEAAGEFADYTWAIVKYENDGTSWHDPILQLVRHIVRVDSAVDTASYDYDICVVAALREELDALLNVPWEWEDLRIPGDATSYKRGTFVSGETHVRIVAACSPRMGMISAAVLASNMIRTFRPRILATVGICAGIRGKVSIGDVAVADPSWDYQSGKISSGSFEMAPHQLPLNPAIRRRIAALDDRVALEELKQAWTGEAPSEAVAVHLGPFASGSAVLADDVRLEELRRQHRNLIAIDMEVYGIYTAAAEAPIPVPFPVAVKAVSDYGDDEKGDAFRAYACYVSASFFSKFIVQEYVDLVELLGCGKPR